jgi:hypothetical protein
MRRKFWAMGVSFYHPCNMNDSSLVNRLRPETPNIRAHTEMAPSMLTANHPRRRRVTGMPYFERSVRLVCSLIV